MGINTTVLPDNSPYIGWAFDVAIEVVNLNFQCIQGPIYLLMVYNLAGHNLITFAQDQPGQTFFKDTRKDFGIFAFTAGVVQSSSDEGTSTSLMVPDQFKNLTVNQLGLLKTPWGQVYMGYAQAYGTNWGIS